jgi:hypothetical protein
VGERAERVVRKDHLDLGILAESIRPVFQNGSRIPS